MDEVKDIIKLLEEDEEYALIQGVKEKVELARTYGLATWHDDLGRKMLLISKLINTSFMLKVKDYRNHVQTVYHDNTVVVHIIN